jgi:cytochrome P450
MTTTEPLIVVRRYPIAGVCALLGVPRQDRRLFCRWAAGPLTPKALDALYTYVDVMIADRCRRSTDDLVSKLIELEVDGEELAVDDIRRFVAALVAGAN